MTTVNILSGGAAQGLVRGLSEPFKAQTGFGIDGEFGAVGVMADKLRAGTPADLVILTQALACEARRRRSSSSPPRSQMSAGSRPRWRSAAAIRR